MAPAGSLLPERMPTDPPYTHVLAADLGWRPSSSRVALALCSSGDRAAISAGGRDDTVFHETLAALPADARVLVLLDVPIEGLHRLDPARTRQVDRAVAGAGIAALPANMAGLRGPALRNALLSAHGSRLAALRVAEMYPYAVYRVLTYLATLNRLTALAASCPAAALLDGSFLRARAPKYKRRQPDRALRWQAIASLHALLRHLHLGMRWASLPAPDAVRGRAEDILVDRYDAALGAVLGALILRGSPYAVLAGNQDDGEIALIADSWLRDQLARRIPVSSIACQGHSTYRETW